MLSIAVIGGGPGGLFFCHAIEKIQRENPDTKVHVSCFERSSQPGGVWRAASSGGSDTDMYAQLWSNGSSHCLEFHDYTFDQHFGKAVPVYLKRQELWEYIIGRVQHKCPHFLQKYLRFRHSVDHVAFDDATQKFAVTVCDMVTETVTTEHFDKCIWACGENSRRHIPKPLAETFEDFHGPVLHSADVADIDRFTSVVRNKTVLLVGGGYSAEDIALQAIQTGAKHVYLCCRSGYTAEANCTEQWPGNKVTVVPDQTPFLVTGKGHCIQFHYVKWSYDHYERDGSEVSTKIRDVDTVICCTGYRKNLDMLEPRLREGGFPSHEFRAEEKVSVPADFELPATPLGNFAGDVPLADEIDYPAAYLHPNFYQGVLLANTNMMFLSQYGTALPLTCIEAHCALLAGFAAGSVPLPSPEEMKERNHQEALRLLKMPFFRYDMDRNFSKAVNDAWPETDTFEEYDKAALEAWADDIRRIAAILNEAKYPVSIGTRHELNDMGRKLYDMGFHDYLNRAELKAENSDELVWKTFRDITDTSMFQSIFTGTKAVPLGTPWMRLQEEAMEKENGRASPRSVDDPPPLLA